MCWRQHTALAGLEAEGAARHLQPRRWWFARGGLEPLHRTFAAAILGLRSLEAFSLSPSGLRSLATPVDRQPDHPSLVKRRQMLLQRMLASH